MVTQSSGSINFLAPNQGQTLQVLQDTLRILEEGDGSQTQYQVFELTGPMNSGPPPHRHPWAESFFILEGEVELLFGDQTMVGRPGDFVSAAAEQLHTFRIISQTARFLVITSGISASKFFKEMDQSVGHDCSDMDRVMAVASRHHVIPDAPV
ncbi:cupin domain-containing protein [Lyngbya confervoides]|uniref:Cupin domain-containing protein n=1 Tax=Lyngbya confervoides BDU141951 TaxID=1574623 RepID=A0ABD4T568_9CYAN|nr:cupin domain-containing protein [Lyngbya confervoides]MCM1983662.1 cupin domain-containing protein [Lyngbya confervoides BDU141951]